MLAPRILAPAKKRARSPDRPGTNDEWQRPCLTNPAGRAEFITWARLPEGGIRLERGSSSRRPGASRPALSTGNPLAPPAERLGGLKRKRAARKRKPQRDGIIQPRGSAAKPWVSDGKKRNCGFGCGYPGRHSLRSLALGCSRVAPSGRRKMPHPARWMPPSTGYKTPFNKQTPAATGSLPQPPIGSPSAGSPGHRLWPWSFSQRIPA